MTLTILVILGAAIYLDMGLGALVMLFSGAPPRSLKSLALVLLWPIALAAVVPSMVVMAQRSKR